MANFLQPPISDVPHRDGNNFLAYWASNYVAVDAANGDDTSNPATVPESGDYAFKTLQRALDFIGEVETPTISAGPYIELRGGDYEWNGWRGYQIKPPFLNSVITSLSGDPSDTSITTDSGMYFQGISIGIYGLTMTIGTKLGDYHPMYALIGADCYLQDCDIYLNGYAHDTMQADSGGRWSIKNCTFHYPPGWSGRSFFRGNHLSHLRLSETITFVNEPTWTNGCITLDEFSTCLITPGTTFVGSAIGPRYVVQNGSKLLLPTGSSGTFIPGNAAGIVTSDSVYSATAVEPLG